MHYMVNSRLHKEINPWTFMLSSLKRHATCPTPRQLAPWQHFMSLKATELEDAFTERWPHAGLEPKDSLAFRGMIARELRAPCTGVRRVQDVPAGRVRAVAQGGPGEACTDGYRPRGADRGAVAGLVSS